MSVWTVVVAGGSGARFGRLKQFELLAGRLVVEHSIAAARPVSDGVIVVVPPAWSGELAGADRLVAGGRSRSESVRAGLAAVPADAAIVVVHDGARPLAQSSLFQAVIQAVRDGADGAVPVVGLTDTIRRRSGGSVDREDLVAVQTPQAFAAAALRNAHAAGPDATDDATLVELSGARVELVDGDPSNLKITHAADLAVARARLAERAAPGGATGPGPLDIRIGQGFDVHRFSAELARPLILGGVEIPAAPGLVGHSDADAVAHAVTDAILGAAGLGDIGQLYPDTDPRYRGIDSLVLLADTVDRAHRAGWRVTNVDCTVVTEAPRLAPHRPEMEAKVSEVVGAPVTIKGKRAEELGALGRREGLACLAVVLLLRVAGS